MKRITALLCAVLLLLSLTACGKAGTPKDTADSFFKAMQKLDFDAMNECTTNEANVEWDLGASGYFSEETTQKMRDIFQSLAAKVEYELGDVESDDTTATVPAKVTYPDASPMVRDAMTDVMANMVMSLLGEESDTDVYTQLIDARAEKVGSETPAMKTAEVVLPMSKTDEGWKITALSDDVINALSGNVSDAFAEAQSALVG